MQKLFISYSRKDVEFVRKLAGDLEKAGYDVWWDITDLRGGDDWVRQIPEAIRASQHVLVVLTPDSIDSEWVRKEYTQALSLRKKIIPLMLVPASVPFALNTLNFVNFAAGEYADNYKKLLEALDFTGKTPVVQPFKRPLPQGLQRFALPGLMGLILLLILIWTFKPEEPVVTPTDAPTLPASATATHTPETLTVTPTASATSSPTVTFTATQTHTPTVTRTASPTIVYEIRLPICITSESPNIYVRSGPGQTYRAKILDLRDETGKSLNVCPWFSAQITSEGDTWLLLASDQREPSLQEFEGGWIRRDLLDKNIPIDILPAVTLTPTPTASMTFTPSATSTPTHTPEPTDTPTHTPAPTETDTPVPSETPTP